MAQPATIEQFAFEHLDQAVAELQANKDSLVSHERPGAGVNPVGDQGRADERL